MKNILESNWENIPNLSTVFMTLKSKDIPNMMIICTLRKHPRYTEVHWTNVAKLSLHDKTELITINELKDKFKPISYIKNDKDPNLRWTMYVAGEIDEKELFNIKSYSKITNKDYEL